MVLSRIRTTIPLASHASSASFCGTLLAPGVDLEAVALPVEPSGSRDVGPGAGFFSASTEGSKTRSSACKRTEPIDPCADLRRLLVPLELFTLRSTSTGFKWFCSADGTCEGTFCVRSISRIISILRFRLAFFFSCILAFNRSFEACSASRSFTSGSIHRSCSPFSFSITVALPVWPR